MKLLSILFLLLFNLASAQSISNDWIPINSEEESTIYLNSSKIIGYGNELSVWAFEDLTKVLKSEKNGNIKRIKTHYLFNKMKKRFAEIGIIYYDDKGQIINRSSKSNFQGTSAAFMTPIKSNPKVEIIYKEVISFLITGNIRSIDLEDTSLSNSAVKVDNNTEMEIPIAHRKQAESYKEEKELTPEIENVQAEKISNQVTNVGLATTKVSENSDDVVDLTKESWNNIPKIDKKMEINEKPTVSTIEPSKELENYIGEKSINIHESSKAEYNSNSERALKNAIFTDGKLYCFQVSSWKTKAYADRELNKLISEGYNAFLISVKPKHKKSIWHRVRVGYFNTLEETKKAQRSVGRR